MVARELLLRCGALALAAALYALPSLAEPAVYRIDATRTRAEFTVEHLGVFRAQGRFPNVSGRLLYDASAHAGSVDLEIPVDSVATGWDTRDDFIRGTSMFDASQYPRMRFRSTRFEFEGERLVRVDGDLTLRDVTRPVSLSVRKLECGRSADEKREGCVAEAAGAIRRREFAMDAWWPLIGDEVELRFHLIAVRE